jgi:chromosomal replication initiation ATPase DnaA
MELWSEALSKISEKISKPSFETWLANTSAEIHHDVIVVNASNQFAADWIEVRYKELIMNTVRELTGKSFEIEVISADRQLNEKLLPTHKYEEKPSYYDIRNLIQEHHKIVMEQQTKIEQLEKRVYELEKNQKRHYLPDLFSE